MKVILVYILICALLAMYGVMIKNYLAARRLFNKDGYRNPYRRTCKLCGAQQQVMESHQFIDGKKRSWWEETSKGNNPQCECRKQQLYRPN